MIIEKYLTDHTSPEPEHLYRLWRAANMELLAGRMTSGHLQGRLLKMLVEMVRPRQVLEVGTFGGYSALCMAEGLADDDCRIVTFEIDDEMEDFARRWIESSPFGHRVQLIIGDGIKEAPRLGVTFDMAFLDGDKRTYVEAYEAILPIIRKGGFILADNTLWDGHVTDPAYDRDHQTLGIRRFNDHVAADPRTEQVMLPLRDGLTLIRVS
ncbi:MAG: class I SAM-dependent methyltransferase [Prevotella sp.]|nr:class I SAM-dependent methyltransferase [Prevotella sp.]